MKRVYLIFLAAFLIIGCSRTPQLNDLYTDNSTITYGDYNDTATNGEDIKDANTAFNEDMQENSKNISVKQMIDKLKTLTVYFDFDKYDIKSSEWPKVEELAKLIKENKNKFIVRIEGNCDEWGTEEYNYALGLKRANVVKDALIKLGVSPKKITIISYGELNPVCVAHNEKCWAKNRRDDFTYLP